MTEQQVRLVQQTFMRVLPISDLAAQLFYKRLFELDPTLRPMFKGDMQEQGRKLMQMIGMTVQGLSVPGEIMGLVADLGIRFGAGLDVGADAAVVKQIGRG